MLKVVIMLTLCFMGFMTWTAYLWFTMHSVIRDLKIQILDLSKQITHLSSQNRSIREQFLDSKERVDILMRLFKDKLALCSEYHQKEVSNRSSSKNKE